MADSLIRVRLETEGLRELAQADLLGAEKLMAQSAIDILVPLARAEVPSRTGVLRQSIRGSLVHAGDHWGGVVQAMGPGFYGRILAAGAVWREPIVPTRFRGRRGREALKGQEFITPFGTVVRTRQRGGFAALRFLGRGGETFRRMVHHPPLQANPWPERATGRGLAPIAEANERIVIDAIKARVR